jgi:hypothetical protein
MYQSRFLKHGPCCSANAFLQKSKLLLPNKIVAFTIQIYSRFEQLASFFAQSAEALSTGKFSEKLALMYPNAARKKYF